MRKEKKKGLKTYIYAAGPCLAPSNMINERDHQEPEGKRSCIDIT